MQRNKTPQDRPPNLAPIEELDSALRHALPTDVCEALRRSLAMRRDQPPGDADSAQRFANLTRLETCGFDMRTQDLQLRVVAAATPPKGLLRRSNRHYFVLAGGPEAQELTPLTRHATLVKAVEFMMIAYGECCAL
jgi:hypothetical protein